MLDIQKLHQAQVDFLAQYPGGFSNPVMVEIGKKHKMDKMVGLAKEYFSKEACSNILATADNMVKVISRSSMVSKFEKPKFKGFVQRLNNDEKAFLVNALKEMLHGKQQAGFEAMVSILATEKLAKWSVISIVPAYYKPTKEVFVKPTTAKGILKHFNIENPVYNPLPSWDFYKKYRKLINDGKKEVDPSLSPSNAAFSGFLMMVLKF
ncbi:MAG: hypothetical protein QNK31_04835 [Porticoccus sp.]|nr:hypothetical protein [Porticoccus sp.]